MPILSIIVPVYNVASYLEEGLNSILNQEVQDIEIICINDKSTDKSLSILNKYSSKDNRIFVINCVENYGVSKARNIGLQHAKGEYLVFFDPDDIVTPKMYSKMINYIQNQKVDMVMCGFKTYPENKVIIPQFEIKPSSPIDFIKNNKQIHSKNDFCFPWRFLYKRDFLNKHKFKFIEDIYTGSDTVFNFSTIMAAQKIALLPEPLYIYRTNNPNSIVKTKYKPQMESSLQRQIDAKKKLAYKYKIDNYTPYTQDMSEDIVKRYTLMLFNNLRNNPNESDKLQGIKRILNMPMITDAMKVVGFRNIYSSWKEYIFYLAMKFKCARLVHKLYFK